MCDDACGRCSRHPRTGPRDRAHRRSPDHASEAFVGRVIFGSYTGYIGIMEKKMETTIMGLYVV